MPNAEPETARRHDLHRRRWANVVLRGLHLVAVIALGALLLGASVSPPWSAGRVAAAVLATGLVMLALDIQASRRHLRTVAGIASLAKLALFGLLAVWHEPLLFWAVVAFSAVVSHAPATVRHRVVIAPRGAGVR